MISKLMDYENGQLNTEETLNLFAELVANKMAWSLQGFYGRTAHSLIENGLITTEGKLTEKAEDFIMENA